MPMKILVTGAAGFIGFSVAKALLERGDHVVGIDNVNPYYSVALKERRLRELSAYPHFHFQKGDIADRSFMENVFAESFDRVVNLAAQAGVRYSLQNPHAYVDANLVGFLNILECCRHAKTPHLVYASTSSVYGLNTTMPFSVSDNVDHPVSLYAATKKANELMAHTYSHLYGLPTTGLRFFTVYGPWGRPDMALFKFTRAILQDEEIEVYNEGKMQRDFTYIDDIVNGVVRTMDRIPQGDSMWNAADPNPASSKAPYQLYNIGNHRPVELLHFIDVIEKSLGKKARKKLLPLQPGDVPATYADIDAIHKDVGYAPSTSIEEGIP
ncbi:MAG: NAD-dependent epimerase, partial [Deltaproteobacteria bacterium]|nr:NAD-dependent epimerase [Deltaproteobacteria bacterium]